MTRGRKPGSRSVHPDVFPFIWISVRDWCEREEARTGKSSVKKACDALASIGIRSAIGGNRDALADANAKRKKRWPCFEIDPVSSRLRPSAAGPIFISHAITNGDSLRARYYEANRIAKSDPRVRAAWINMWRQMQEAEARQAAAKPRNLVAN
ncbi:hypothetical protein GCM10007857_55850 [Bradyrhizobium iriomotense]|uniref:Uncharacterized protein n=1 Tax=Bradyrhizobium iriomotense TaxID=441950 RepID=A0ABQ6B384_9BRAD|nr:hypothetical protein GCM10007857_55850 [Bradyrhizobium iriomotense]